MQGERKVVRSCILDKALLPDGWANHVRVDIAEDGTIAGVQPGAAPDGAERIRGIALPGLRVVEGRA